ncbi:MAG: hypothetical protein H7Y60_12855 [Rhodospirillaceae bacterium]|nr:hypothetical protein [Rhodospirillales bacterium]
MTCDAENAEGKQRGKPFPKGQSGNPAGKPKGALHHATRAVMTLLDGEADALTRKAVELALAGDTTALRLCLERLAPPAKDKPISVSLPPMAGAEDASKAMAAVVAAMGAGDITPSEAAAVAGVVETYRRTVETCDIERRLAALEEKGTAK